MSDDELTEEIAGMLVRIENNYLRETSGPGSRFEGQRLEVVQAKAVIRRTRERDSGETAAGRLWAENSRLRRRLAEVRAVLLRDADSDADARREALGLLGDER